MTFDEHKALAMKLAVVPDAGERTYDILQALRDAYYAGRADGCEAMAARAQQVIEEHFK